jgi:hypothetical protein
MEFNLKVGTLHIFFDETEAVAMEIYAFTLHVLSAGGSQTGRLHVLFPLLLSSDSRMVKSKKDVLAHGRHALADCVALAILRQRLMIQPKSITHSDRDALQMRSILAHHTFNEAAKRISEKFKISYKDKPGHALSAQERLIMFMGLVCGFAGETWSNKSECRQQLIICGSDMDDATSNARLARLDLMKQLCNRYFKDDREKMTEVRAKQTRALSGINDRLTQNEEYMRARILPDPELGNPYEQQNAQQINRIQYTAVRITADENMMTNNTALVPVAQNDLILEQELIQALVDENEETDVSEQDAARFLLGGEEHKINRDYALASPRAVFSAIESTKTTIEQAANAQNKKAKHATYKNLTASVESTVEFALCCALNYVQLRRWSGAAVSVPASEIHTTEVIFSNLLKTLAAKM